MKASQLMEELGRILKEHGDIWIVRGASEGMVYPFIDRVEIHESEKGDKVGVIR